MGMRESGMKLFASRAYEAVFAMRLIGMKVHVRGYGRMSDW